MNLKQRITLPLLLVSLLAVTLAYGVTIKEANGKFMVTGKNYTAVIDGGCIPSLRVNDVEILNSTAAISRGFYLFVGGKPLIFTDVKKSSTLITAHAGQATLAISFSNKAFDLTVKNTSNANITAFFVFDANLRAIRNEDGTYVKPAVTMQCNSTTLFFAGAKIALKGSDRIWGPWQGGLQVWEAVIPPGETRPVEMEFDEPSKEEIEEIDKLGRIEEKQVEPLVVISPRQYQVFQRSTINEGRVLISGRVNPDFDRVAVRVTGKPLSGVLQGNFEPVASDALSHSFFSTVTIAAGGWFTFEIAAWKGADIVVSAKIENVGVGEVFVGAGQSNSTNCGETQLKCGSLLVSTFSGEDWRIADDPQPGCHDKSTRGSFWPAFGDAMYEKYKVPIGVAVTGHGGTSVNAWQPGGDLFQWATNRMHQLGKGGFRAVLWHQGESDVNMQCNDYAAKMNNMMSNSKLEVGWEFPWFVAHVSYHNPTAKSFESTRNAQQWLIDNGYALEGPDTDTLDEPYREKDGKGIHFNEAGLKEHGKMWAAKVSIWLDKVLAK